MKDYSRLYKEREVMTTYLNPPPPERGADYIDQP